MTEYSASEISKRVAGATHLLGYYDQQTLASYITQPEKYVVETDSFAGTLTVTNSYYEELEQAGKENEYLHLHFGYRTLASGDLAIVVWLPDLTKARMHVNRWSGFQLHNAVWTSDDDERFSKWMAVYLEGSWDVGNGPKQELAEVMETINGLTSEVVGNKLFKNELDASVTFPTAENTHRYQDAHTILYGYLIDGLDKQCLSLLAAKLGKPSGFDSDRTLDVIRKVLPECGGESKFGLATSKISEQRRIASHSVRPRAVRFQAFSTFTADLLTCVAGLKELLEALEHSLGVNGMSAQERDVAKRGLPRLAEQVQANASVIDASLMQGKTVEKVEYGEREPIKGVHGSEAIIIHFTDGSIVSIDTGSNAMNIASRFESLRAEDFHADFRLNWVPPLR